MSGGPDTGGSAVEQVLRRQAGQARRRDRVRVAAGVAVWPTALGAGAVLAHFGAADGPGPFVSWLLLMLAFVLLIGWGGWAMARMLWPVSVPRWPRSRRAARVGGFAALVVASIAAVVLARTAPLAAVLVWAAVSAGLVLLWVRERHLDRRVEQLGHEVAVLVGYR